MSGVAVKPAPFFPISNIVHGQKEHTKMSFRREMTLRNSTGDQHELAHIACLKPERGWQYADSQRKTSQLTMNLHIRLRACSYFLFCIISACKIHIVNLNLFEFKTLLMQ